MQHAFILTKIESYVTEREGQVFRLGLLDYCHRDISVLGSAEQQINIMAIQNQHFPIVVLSDQIERSIDERIEIPATALVSIVPIAAMTMQGVIDAGKAEEILKSLSLKSC